MESDVNSVVASVDKVWSFILKYKNIIVSFFAIIVATAAIVFGYRYYRCCVQERAYEEFTKALEYFDAPVVKDSSSVKTDKWFSSQKEKWTASIDSFSKGYQNNSSSTLAPLFLAFQSEALYRSGAQSEAIDVLRRAVDQMTNKVFKESYTLKLALMRIDSQSEIEQQKGVQVLERLAFKKNSVVHPWSLYHLGYYFWMRDNVERAKSYWQQFVVLYGNETNIEKEILDVQSKLALISV